MGKRSNGEGSVVKRKDGRWCAAFNLNGKRKYRYGKTRKEVVGKMMEVLAKTDVGTYYPDIKIEDYLDQWLADSIRGSVRTRTYERYESVCRVHIIPELGHTARQAGPAPRSSLGTKAELPRTLAF